MANEIVKDDLGFRIRLFFRQLLGSRIAVQLEDELTRARLDFDSRLNERNELISSLRAEIEQLKAELQRAQMVLLPTLYGPLISPRRRTMEPVIEPPAGLAALQEEYDRLQDEALASQEKK